MKHSIILMAVCLMNNRIIGIEKHTVDINDKKLTRGLYAWRAYQLMGMYETLIITEADTGHMKIWDNPFSAYFIVKTVKMITATEKTYE